MTGSNPLGLLALLPAASTPAFTVVAVLAGCAGAAALWLAPDRLGVVRLTAIALVAATVTGALGLLVLVPGGLQPFGAVHVAYLGLVVSVPMLGVALGARVLASATLPHVAAVGAAVLLLPAAVGWYATHVEPYRLRIDRVTVPVDGTRSGDDPVRIGVLSDLQTARPGGYEHAAVDRLLAEEPDLILLPGDLFQGDLAAFAAHEGEMRALLRRLEAPHGVFLVRGDVDVSDYADRLVRGSGITLLDDEIVDLQIGDRRVRLGGNRLRYTAGPAVALRRQLEGTGAATGENTGGTAPGATGEGTGGPAGGDAPGPVPAAADDGTVRILVAHRPDAALDLAPDSRVDVTIAGHTHGGQIVVPGFGPLATASGVPRDVARGGLHEINGNRIFVATGVGLERGQAPQVRLFCRPALGLVELV